jgi:hypothetical protein
VAHKKEEEAREAGDFGGEMGWPAKPLAASGYSIVGSPLGDDLFDFKPERAKDTVLCNACMGSSKLKSLKSIRLMFPDHQRTYPIG